MREVLIVKEGHLGANTEHGPKSYKSKAKVRMQRRYTRRDRDTSTDLKTKNGESNLDDVTKLRLLLFSIAYV